LKGCGHSALLKGIKIFVPELSNFSNLEHENDRSALFPLFDLAIDLMFSPVDRPLAFPIVSVQEVRLCMTCYAVASVQLGLGNACAASHQHRSLATGPISGSGIGENIAKTLGFWILSGIIERLFHIFA
jgi:hypothetical protein